MQDRELEERVKRALEESRLTRRSLLRRGVVFGAGLTALPAIAAACGGDDTSTSGATGTGGGTPSVPASGADISMDDLIAAAKEEGTLNTIALPPDWANYGEIMDTFQSKYGIKINNANPNGSSAEENQAVKSLKGQDRAPDVLDVGPSFAAEGKTGEHKGPERKTNQQDREPAKSAKPPSPVQSGRRLQTAPRPCWQVKFCRSISRLRAAAVTVSALDYRATIVETNAREFAARCRKSIFRSQPAKRLPQGSVKYSAAIRSKDEVVRRTTARSASAA